MSGVEFSPVGPSNAAPRALLGTGTTHAGVGGLKGNGHRVDGILPAWAWPRKLSPPWPPSQHNPNRQKPLFWRDRTGPEPHPVAPKRVSTRAKRGGGETVRRSYPKAR